MRRFFFEEAGKMPLMPCPSPLRAPMSSPVAGGQFLSMPTASHSAGGLSPSLGELPHPATRGSPHPLKGDI